MIFLGINFWPVSALRDTLGQILNPLDPSLSVYGPESCWSTAGLTFNVEAYITLQTVGTNNFPLLVNITLQNVVGCDTEDGLPLLAAMMKSPNSLNSIGELVTAPVLSIRSCSFVSSQQENDVTKCAFNCRDEAYEEISPNGIQGYALRLETLKALGSSFGVCSITG